MNPLRFLNLFGFQNFVEGIVNLQLMLPIWTWRNMFVDQSHDNMTEWDILPWCYRRGIQCRL